MNTRVPVAVREHVFVGLAFVLAIVLTVLITTVLADRNGSQPQLNSSEESKKLDYPTTRAEEYAHLLAALGGLLQGAEPYPQGHKLMEFSRMKSADARRRSDLAWVERGPATTGGRARVLALDPTDPTNNTWYVGSAGGGLWRGVRSMDAAGFEDVEWTPLTDDLPNLSVGALAVAASDPNVLYLGTGEGYWSYDVLYGVGLFKSEDAGTTWHHLSATIQPTSFDWAHVFDIKVDPTDADVLVVATAKSIHRSLDGGRTFERVFRLEDSGSLARITDLEVRPDNFDMQFAAVSTHGVLRSVDAGRSWAWVDIHFTASDLTRLELDISQSHPDNIYLASTAQGGQLYRSGDGGNTWGLLPEVRQPIPTWLDRQGMYNNTVQVHPFSPDTVWLGGVFRWRTVVQQDSLLVYWLSGSEVSNLHYLRRISFFGSNAEGVELEVDDPNTYNVSPEQATSVVLLFGQGTQKAHRFTVAEDAGFNGDGGPFVGYDEYQYRDYVEVPFTVWDTEANRQLMVSFRDQSDDGAFDLTTFSTSGSRNEQSREYIFVHRFTYAEEPYSGIAQSERANAVGNGQMYSLWPVLRQGYAWDPDNLPQGEWVITYAKHLQPGRATRRWKNDGVHVDHHGMLAIPINASRNEFELLGVNDGGLAYSRDSGQNWIEADQFSGFNTAQFYDATKHPTPGVHQYVGGTQDNGTWLSRSGRVATMETGWRFVLAGDGFDVVWNKPDSLIASTYFMRMGRSFDGGRTWKPGTNRPTVPEEMDDAQERGIFLTSLATHPESPDVVFTIGHKGIWRTQDYGDTWKLVSQAHDGEWERGYQPAAKVRVSIANPDVVWGGFYLNGPNGTSLRVSRDGGDTFARVRRPRHAPAFPISGLATHPHEPATAYVLYSAFNYPKVFRTTDYGETWSDLSAWHGTRSQNGFPNSKVFDLVALPESNGVLWAGTDFGIAESLDNGNTWHLLDTGLPASGIWRFRIVDRELVVATHGRGVWTLNLDSIKDTYLSAAVAAELPDKPVLLPNYPNPFNPTTTITFSLPVAAKVRVRIYDTVGREVAFLADRQYGAGTHGLQWDASRMASGMYFARLDVNGTPVGTQQMTLLK